MAMQQFGFAGAGGLVLLVLCACTGCKSPAEPDREVPDTGEERVAEIRTVDIVAVDPANAEHTEHHSTVSALKMDGALTIDVTYNQGGAPLGNGMGASFDLELGQPDASPRPRAEPWLLFKTPGSGPSRPEVTTEEETRVVAWNSKFDVHIARFDDAGQTDPPVQVNSSQGNVPQRGFPDVALLESGWVIVWESVNDLESPASRYFFRRLDSQLVPMGDEVELANSERGSPPAVVAHQGGFATVWTEWHGNYSEVWVANFGPSGDAEWGPVLLQTTASDVAASRPGIAANVMGDLVLSWNTTDGNGTEFGAKINVMDSSGSVLFADPIEVGTTGPSSHAVVGLAGDTAIVAWEERDLVFLQPFDIRSGEPLLDPLPADEAPAFNRSYPSVYVVETLPRQLGIALSWNDIEVQRGLSSVHLGLYELDI